MKYLISFLFLALAFSMKSEAKVTLPSILGSKQKSNYGEKPVPMLL